MVFSPNSEFGNKSHMKNPICKNGPFCKTFQSKENDKYLRYYKAHFKIHEERFFGHIQDIVINIKENNFRLSRHNLPDIKDISNYHHFQVVDLNNFGCCFLSKSKATGEDVVVKHILNSYSKHQTKYILKDTEKRLLINSSNFEKLLNQIVIDKKYYQSIWYVFDYRPTLGLDVIMKLLHETILGYSVNHESEFVHLLYTCNGMVDKSRESFPNFMNIVKCISVQLLCGLTFLHEKGMVHKYLNPANIRLSVNGVLRITDFGVTKRFQWLHYNSRSLVEAGVGVDCTNYKDPIKRMKLAGNFYYLEPHLRVLYSNDKGLSKKFSDFNNLSYHMDYFSCSMVFFELLFGFTYGDVELFKNYSFYEHFGQFELIFFFSDHYLEISRKHPNLNLAIKDFKKFRLNNLKSFLINLEDGFLNFIIDGLSSDVCRWSKFFRPSVNGQSLDLSILQQEISFFRKLNFINSIQNIPPDFHNMLINYSKKINLIECSMGMDKVPKIENKIKYNLLPRDKPNMEINANSNFSTDLNSFCIPELPAQNQRPFLNVVNNSSKITEKSMLSFQHKPHNINKKKIFYFNNNKGEEEIQDLLHGSSNREDIALVSENKEMKTSEDQFIHKKYSGVFVHEFFNNLQKRRLFHKSINHERIRFLENRGNLLSKDFETSSISKTKIPLYNSKESQMVDSFSTNNDFGYENQFNINRKVEKNCSHHSKHSIIKNKNPTNRKYRRFTKHLKSKYSQNKNYIKQHLSENHNRGISADLPYLSEYELRQYQMYSRYSVPQTSSQSSRCTRRKKRSISRSIDTCFLNIGLNKIENKDSFEIEEFHSNILHSPKELFKVQNNDLINITASGSTQLPKDVILTNKNLPINNGQLNIISDFQNSVIEEVQSKNISNNFSNDLGTNLDTCDLGDLLISSKHVILEPPSCTNKFMDTPYLECDALEYSKKGNLTTQKFQTKERLNFRKKEFNQLDTMDEHLKFNRKRNNLKDSNVLELFTKPSNLNRKQLNTKISEETKDEMVQTYTVDLLCTDYSTLFNNPARKLANSLNSLTHSVFSLVSKDCQTQDDEATTLKNSNIQCDVAQVFSKNIEIQTMSNDEVETADLIPMPDNDNVSIQETVLEKDYNEFCHDEDNIVLMDEIEIVNPNLNFEEDTIILNNNAKFTQEDPICCNESELVSQSNNFVEHFSETSDRTIQLFNGLPWKDHSLLSVLPEMEIKSLRKSVNFRSPIISDIFDSEFVKLDSGNVTYSNIKGILKESCEDHSDKSETISLTNNMKVPYFLRPKINNRQLEIIDEWHDFNVNSVKNYLSRDFNLQNLEKICLVPNSDDHILPMDSTNQDCHSANENQI